MILETLANFQSRDIAQPLSKEKWRSFPAEVQL
jgi:hypothetical protein